MSGFVGKDRVALVEELVADFDACIAASEPRLVCLLGDVGYGKTRVVQEFYRRIQAERQPSGTYWPSEFEPVGRDPMRSRKFVYPEDPVPHLGAPLPWLWWGLRCDKDSSGRKVCALFNDRTQLRAHLAGLIESAERHATDRELAMEALGQAVGLIPGVGTFLSLAWAAKSLSPRLLDRLQRALERGRARRHEEGESKAVRTSSLETRTEFEPDVEFVRRFISSRLPLVLIVDDAHDADSVTVRFIRELMQLRLPILVIATAWPFELDEQAKLERTMGEAETFGGFLAEATQLLPKRTTQRELSPLADKAALEMIEIAAPATDLERKSALAQASGGIPLVLALQLSTGKVLRSIRSDAITLPVDQLLRLPRTYEELVAARFSELSHLEQRWLAEAAWQGPVFFPDAIAVAGVDVEHLSRFARVRPDGQLLVGRFVEKPIYAAVQAVADDEFSDEERASWRRFALAHIAASDTDLNRFPADTASRAARGELIVQLAEADGEAAAAAPPSTIARAAIEWSFAERDLGNREDERAAADVASRWAERVPRDLGLQVKVLTRRAAALQASNAMEEALGTAEIAATKLRSWADAPMGQASDTLWVLCRAQRLAGQLKAARDTALEAQRLADRANDQANVVSALRALAAVEADAGDKSAEAAAISSAIEIVRATAAVNVELLIDLQSDLHDVGLFGDPPAAWQDLVGVAERELGRGNWLHIYCMYQWATALMLAGLIDDSEGVVDQIRAIDTSTDAEDAIASLDFLLRIQRGDFTCVPELLEWSRKWARQPYASQASQMFLKAAEETVTALGLGNGPSQPAETWLGALTTRLVSDPQGGLLELADTLRTGSHSLEDLERSQAVAFAGDVMLRWFVQHRTLPAPSAELLPSLRAIAEADSLPPLTTANLDAMEDAAKIIRGEEPGSWRLLGHDLITCRAAASRAVAWFIVGEEQRSNEQLAVAREAAERASNWNTWNLVAAAHTSCHSPALDEVWKSIVQLPSLTADQRLEALTVLGTVLYNADRYSEAEDAEREAWADARSRDDVPDTMAHRVGQNLISTLLARGESPNAEPILAIRRELLSYESDTKAHLENLQQLSQALADEAGVALTLARRAELLTDRNELVAALDALAVRLFKLGHAHLALDVTAMSVAAQPSLTEGESAVAAVSNLAAIIRTIHPNGVAGLETRLRAAGIESRLDHQPGSKSWSWTSHLELRFNWPR